LRVYWPSGTVGRFSLAESEALSGLLPTRFESTGVVGPSWSSWMRCAEKHMAPDTLNAMLRSMSARLADDPARRPIVHQLNILLTSAQTFMSGANDLGRLLVDAGLLDDAQELYGALAEHFPNQPAGPVGMADLAMRRGAWQEALTRWDEVIARFGDQPAVTRMGGRATALMELQRLDEAETIFRSLVEDFSQQPPGFVGLARLAMGRGFWTEALKLWDEVLTRFSDQAKPYWHAGRATTLTQLGRLDEAENIFRRLADDFPTQSSGFLGLADIAVRRRNWNEALVWWDEVIARFPRTANPYWQVARANVLVELGRTDEAEPIFRHMTESTPESLSALNGLLRVLIAKGKPEDAALELESSCFRSIEVAAVIEKRFEILTLLRRLGDARAEFEQLLRKTNDLTVLDTLFAHAAALYDRWRRKEIWTTLLKRLDSVKGVSDSEPAAALALRARILLALRDYDQFLAVIARAKEHALGEHWRSLLSVESKLRGPSFPDYDAPKVFGIGLSRTGTTSLTAALTALGFHTLHWLNPLTCETICIDDLHLFDAFTDTPVCVNFENYYFMFPNSKFIYTVRPFESWQKSMQNYFSRRFGLRNFQDVKLAMARSDDLPDGTDFSNIQLSLYFNHSDYKDAYCAYQQRVRRFFQDKPKDRFLEFDVFAGRWEVLCSFTGRAKPSTPFPWLNRKP
jgi:tetratricopeptide (TPR) repeat protein